MILHVESGGRIKSSLRSFLIVMCGFVFVTTFVTIVAVYPVVMQFGYQNDRFNAFVRIARENGGVLVGDNSWAQSIDVVDLSKSEMNQEEVNELLSIGEGISIRQLILPTGYETNDSRHAAKDD